MCCVSEISQIMPKPQILVLQIVKVFILCEQTVTTLSERIFRLSKQT